MMLRAGLLAFLAFLALMSIPARCEDDRAEIRRMLISSCRTWDNCGQYFRPQRQHYHERHIELRRVWRRDDRADDGQDRGRDWRRWREDDWRDLERRRVTHDDRKRDGYHCVGTEVEVLSGQRTTKDDALGDAAERWAGRTQWIHGGQYMDIGESARYRFRCGPTQPGDGASQKAARIGNAIAEVIPGTPQNRARKDGEETGAWRCEVVAMPCREAREWGDRDQPTRKRR